MLVKLTPCWKLEQTHLPAIISGREKMQKPISIQKKEYLQKNMGLPLSLLFISRWLEGTDTVL